MKIKELELTNFKRFSHLRISNIPVSSKLVLLIGSNGSGKSSVFDGFDWLSKGLFKGYPIDGNEYYRKDKSKESSFYASFHDDIKIRKTGDTFEGPHEIVRKFIGRSSIRIVPRISNNSNVDAISVDSDSPNTYIDNDSRFLNDISLYINQIDFALREPVFKGEQADTLKIFHEQIKPLNDSLDIIFGGTEDTRIRIAEYRNATPNSSAQLIFKKGESKINYDLLSHGEKQVIILLLNFLVRRKQYENSIVFIDEMDCHLNTSLQYRLISEIVHKWIPESSQLWTASHALGFIDFAKKSDQASIIDFDLLNFDVSQELTPESKDTVDVYEIAIPKNLLFDIIDGKRIIFCENQNDEYYQLLQIKNSLFVGLADSREVFLEIKKLKVIYPNLFILEYYNFENYLFHPDNLSELQLIGFDKNEYRLEIKRQKDQNYDRILINLKTSRNYEEFKTDKIKTDNVDEIIASLKSDSFEEFYKYFDMKRLFSKIYLEKFNLNKTDLCQTNWFRSKIKSALD
jgi:ABC-type iron transport system FetAB ATPase subunit